MTSLTSLPRIATGTLFTRKMTMNENDLRFHNIPREIQLQIHVYLSPMEIRRLRSTGKGFRNFPCFIHEQKELMHVIRAKNIHRLEYLLESPFVDVSLNHNRAFQLACLEGWTEGVKLMLTYCKPVESNSDENTLDGRPSTRSVIDPGDNEDFAIRWAASKGYSEIVSLLLFHPLVNPTSMNQLALTWAARNGHLQTILLLLKHPRVEAHQAGNFAIRRASQCGHVDVVKQLLSYPQVDPTAYNNDALRWAAANGYASVVELLLSCEGVDPAAGNNEALRYAAYSGHEDVVKLLLMHSGVDPGAMNNEAVRQAFRERRWGVVRLLLQDKRVRVSPFFKLKSEIFSRLSW